MGRMASLVVAAVLVVGTGFAGGYEDEGTFEAAADPYAGLADAFGPVDPGAGLLGSGEASTPGGWSEDLADYAGLEDMGGPVEDGGATQAEIDFGMQEWAKIFVETGLGPAILTDTLDEIRRLQLPAEAVVDAADLSGAYAAARRNPTAPFVRPDGTRTTTLANFAGLWSRLGPKFIARETGGLRALGN